MFLEQNVALYFMDSSTRPSHGAVVINQIACEAIDLFDALGVSLWVSILSPC